MYRVYCENKSKEINIQSKVYAIKISSTLSL